MKEFAVNVDITMSKTLYVEAESEEQAIQIANGKILDDPYDAARTADAYVSHEVFDAYICD